MVYINPIEILDLKKHNANEINSSIIKKAKRILFADIELSDDGFYKYYGKKLTKSDCEKAIEELENRNKVEFYLHLSNNSELNRFLADEQYYLLCNFKHESIYSLQEFKDFVSPFISVKIDLLLLRSYTSNNLEMFNSVLTVLDLVTPSDQNNAYKSLSNELRQQIEETDQLARKVKDEIIADSDDSISNLADIIRKRFPLEILNKLPKYFQSQLNLIAQSINFLQVEIYNVLNLTSVPLFLSEHILALNIESFSKPTFEKNYQFIKDRHLSNLKYEGNKPLLQHWAKILLSIQSKIEELENESVGSNDIVSIINSKFTIDEINNLPNFADDIRLQIVYSLRSLSIVCWNNQSNLNAALNLIDLATAITINDTDLMLKLFKDKAELKKLEKKYAGILVCYFCSTDSPDEKCSIHRTMYKLTKKNYFTGKVEYLYTDIVIPRCQKCKNIHMNSSAGFYFILWGLTILGIFFSNTMINIHPLVGGFSGFVLGWIIAASRETKRIEKTGIKDDSQSSLEKHPVLIEQIEDGWTFSKPSA